MDRTEKNKRRELLALGIIAGAGALAGAGISSMASESKKQTVKMMTASGELVEVDIRHLPKKMREKPISNAALKEWIDKEKILDASKNNSI